MNWPFPINFNNNKRTPESQRLLDLYAIREYNPYGKDWIDEVRKRNADSKTEDALI